MVVIVGSKSWLLLQALSLGCYCRLCVGCDLRLLVLIVISGFRSWLLLQALSLGCYCRL